MLSGGITILGFWVYCSKEEIKETRCLNLLAGMLAKAKKFIKENDPLLLMSIYYGQETAPEIWVRDGTNIRKGKEQVSMWNEAEKLIELKTQLPISVIYPLTKNNTEDAQLKDIIKIMTNSLKEYIEGLKCTVDDRIVKGDERINTSKVKICLKQIELPSSIVWEYRRSNSK